MVWIKVFPEVVPAVGGCVAAVGNFDGVHAGHRHLLAVAKGEAVRRGLPLAVLTFEPHPRTVLRPDVPLKILNTLDEKVVLLGQAGVEGVAVLSFTPEVAGWSPQRFIDGALVGWLGATVVCVGEDFRFGHRAAGDVAMLQTQTQFTTLAVPLLTDEAGVVSSSRLRSSQ